MFNNNRGLLITLFGVVFILFVISHFIPIGYFVVSPGMAKELAPMITVENGYKTQNKGDFLLTAVRSQRATLWDYVYIKLVQPAGKELEDVGEQLPPGMDMGKYLEIMAELMEESKLKAQAIAFETAGYTVDVRGEGVKVVEVMETGAAAEKLQEEDIIVAIDGQKVELATEAVDLIRDREIGDEVMVTVMREEEKIEYELTTVDLESDPGKASIGVLITTKNLDYDFDRQVEFTTDNIIGPSAGGVFALEIYNQLIPEDITGGRRIAGTGTISLDGEIGKIDGVIQKVLAAKKADVDLFLVPEENYKEAASVADDLKLIVVHNFEQMVEELRKY